MQTAGEKPARRKTIAALTTLELSIPLADLGGGGMVSFQVTVLQEGIERERYPENVRIRFELPGEEYALEHWLV